MGNVIYQYQITLSDELTEDLVKELCGVMNIPYDSQKYKCAEMSSNKNGLDSICMLKDVNNENRFILVDTAGYYILDITVRCLEEDHENIKRVLLKAYNDGMNELGWEVDDELPNMFNSPDDAYQQVLKRLNITYI